ncbi:MAG: hypothetical protein ABIQ65_04165 [Thermoanaerobaculia bacterium]
MHLIRIQDRPYAVINGKDYAVLRWFEARRVGPVFIQVAGRTSLTRDDLPQADWLVKGARDGTHRLATAWRHPWFDYRLDADRKLAFLGLSTVGSVTLALGYLARRFGIAADQEAIRARANTLAGRWDGPFLWRLERLEDSGLSESSLVIAEVAAGFSSDQASQLLGIETEPAGSTHP